MEAPDIELLQDALCPTHTTGKIWKVRDLLRHRFVSGWRWALDTTGL